MEGRKSVADCRTRKKITVYSGFKIVLFCSYNIVHSVSQFKVYLVPLSKITPPRLIPRNNRGTLLQYVIIRPATPFLKDKFTLEVRTALT